MVIQALAMFSVAAAIQVLLVVKAAALFTKIDSGTTSEGKRPALHGALSSY
jgi:hypothetical protein